jgi:PAS domain S-box-containing protein
MNDDQTKSDLTLRQRAEEILKTRAAETRTAQSLDEANLLLHELRVDRIEWEIENEELRRMLAKLERPDHLRFFESMDRVNQAILGTNDLEQLMSDVLDAVLTIFDCDRAYLIYPCDPEAASWSVPMERTKPEYPGANARGMEIPMEPESQRVFRTVRATDAPVPFGPGSDHPMPEWVRKQFGVQSQLAMATYPKTGKPWMSGMHQCSHARVWQQEERHLFQEINRRLADGLTSLLAYRSLQESETRYRRIVDTANEGIWVLGPDANTAFVNARMAQMLGYSAEEMIGRTVTAFMFEEDAPNHLIRMESRHQGMAENYERRYRRKNGEAIWTLASATPILDIDHAFQGSFAMFTDITERKRADETLHLQTVELEQEVAERQMAQETLQEQAILLEKEIEERRTAQEQLERVNESLEQRVQERTIELEVKNRELERFNKIFVNRELRMIELKERIRKLEGKLT